MLINRNNCWTTLLPLLAPRITLFEKEVQSMVMLVGPRFHQVALLAYKATKMAAMLERYPLQPRGHVQGFSNGLRSLVLQCFTRDGPVA